MKDWRDIPHDCVVPECSSTNDLVRALGEAGAPHGTWVSATIQTSGRGRSGNSWVSEPGNLFLSLLLRLDGPSPIWSWIPMITALSVRDCVLAIRPDLEARLKVKWPNDLWLDGKKAGGILCEGVGSRRGSYIVVGIGLNCSKAPVGTGSEASSVGISADDLRAALPVAILTSLQSKDPAGWARSFMACAQFDVGTPVLWRDRFDPSQILGEGVVAGLGPSGELQVRMPDGTLKSLYSEDVSVRPGG